MILFIKDVLDPDVLHDIRTWMAGANFGDGGATAGFEAKLVKRNTQVTSEDPRLVDMQKRVTAALEANRVFRAAALPKRIRPPLFSRYESGMNYGTHVDNAMMGGMRTDMSLTLFLSEPESYEGGELVMESTSGEQDVKLAAGSAVLYPTTVLHRVAPVRSGQRLAAVTWVRSLVRDAAEREILFDLETAWFGLFDRLGKTPELDLLSKTQANLMRRWVED